MDDISLSSNSLIGDFVVVGEDSKVNALQESPGSGSECHGSDLLHLSEGGTDMEMNDRLKAVNNDVVVSSSGDKENGYFSSPTDTGLMLSASSIVPFSWKRGTVCGLFHRIISLTQGHCDNTALNVSLAEAASTECSTIPFEDTFVDDSSTVDDINGSNVVVSVEPVALDNLKLTCPASTETVVSESSTLFDSVRYLGSSYLSDPRNVQQILDVMVDLHISSNDNSFLDIQLSVPFDPAGSIRLIDKVSGCMMSTFPLNKMIYIQCGGNDDLQNCFAFTYCLHDGVYSCHVFHSLVPDVGGNVLSCFQLAFKKSQLKNQLPPSGPLADNDEKIFHFNVSLTVKEEDSKALAMLPLLVLHPTLVPPGSYHSVPAVGNTFKIKGDVQKRFMINVSQDSNIELPIDRCFGLLLGTGDGERSTKMQLLEIVSMGCNQGDRNYEIHAHWDPTDRNFTDAFKASHIPATIAIDLVIVGIQEPVRFWLEIAFRTSHPSRPNFFYFSSKKAFHEYIILRLKTIQESEERMYHLICSTSKSEIEHRKNCGLSRESTPEQSLASATEDCFDIDLESCEIMLSGTGSVTKECSADVLLSWGEVLATWRKNLDSRPKQLATLVRNGGIPEALRGEVWQLLAGCHQRPEVMNEYRVLIAREPDKKNLETLQHDLTRTFTGHEFFRDVGGAGQEALFNVCKAYAVYDPVVGYCQGFTYLVAVLLLHMPVEQAFLLIERIMFQYKLRDLFKNHFEHLHVMFFQLERLLEELLPDLYQLFKSVGLEVQMFSSQWFITVFTAKFPLPLVFSIMDLFLLEGLPFCFNVAIAILKISKKKLLKYEKEYHTLCDLQEGSDERDRRKLKDDNRRLEVENGHLAVELISSKVNLRHHLDVAEETIDSMKNNMVELKTKLRNTDHEKQRLWHESNKLKELYRQEVSRADVENNRNKAICLEYKEITSRLSSRIEELEVGQQTKLTLIESTVADCEKCSSGVSDVIVSATDLELSPSHSVKAAVEGQELEMELAQTKLRLVEAECKAQQLEHQLGIAMSELAELSSSAASAGWFSSVFSGGKPGNLNK